MDYVAIGTNGYLKSDGQLDIIALATDGYFIPLSFVSPSIVLPLQNQIITITGQLAYFTGFPDAGAEIYIGPVIPVPSYNYPVIIGNTIISNDQFIIKTDLNGRFSFNMPLNTMFKIEIPVANFIAILTTPSSGGIISISNLF
ncbi:MAG: hypothetical protein ACP5LM_04765 [Thermoplasmata archaeon]